MCWEHELTPDVKELLCNMYLSFETAFEVLS